MQDPSLPYPSTDAQIQSLMARLQQDPIGLASPPKDKKISRHKFTPEEDEVLRNLVTQYGKSDWTAISQHFQNRSPRQCRDRWKHYISPEVITGNWTDADDQLLLDKVQEVGAKWSTIAQLFPGRTDIGVKNHYISLTGRKSKDTKEKAHQRAILLPLGQGDQLSGLSIELPPASGQGDCGLLPDIHQLKGDDDGDRRD